MRIMHTSLPTCCWAPPHPSQQGFEATPQCAREPPPFPPALYSLLIILYPPFSLLPLLSAQALLTGRKLRCLRVVLASKCCCSPLARSKRWYVDDKNTTANLTSWTLLCYFFSPFVYCSCAPSVYCSRSPVSYHSHGSISAMDLGRIHLFFF